MRTANIALAVVATTAAAPAFGVPSFRGEIGSGCTTSSNPQTFLVGTTLPVGTTVVVTLATAKNFVFPGASDSQGNKYLQGDGAVTSGTTGIKVSQYFSYLQVALGASDTITAQYIDASDPSSVCAEVAAYGGVFPYQQGLILPNWIGYGGSVNNEYVTTLPDSLPANWAANASLVFSGSPGAGYAVTPPGDALAYNCTSDGLLCLQSAYQIPVVSAPVSISTFGVNAVDYAAVITGLDGDRLFADGFQGESQNP